MPAVPPRDRADLASRFQAARNLEKAGQWPKAERAYFDLLNLASGYTPARLEAGYRERVHRLPWAFVSSPPPPGLRDPTTPRAADEPPPASSPPTRASLGLPEHGVVYACFNRVDKLDPHTFDRWLQVLHQVPGSVLWLVQEQPLVQQRLRERAVAAGLAPERLVFSAKVATADFPALCALADLFLDTAHYGAGATGVAALQAGLPCLPARGRPSLPAWGPASVRPWSRRN